MAERKDSQYPVPDDLAFPLVDSGLSATIRYEDLVGESTHQDFHSEEVLNPLETPEPTQTTSYQTELQTIAEKMLRQSLFQEKESGVCKTTCERSRKSPEDRINIEIKLRKRYQSPPPIQFDVEHSQFVFTSRITDPPPPSHDIGEVDLEDLDILSRDPEVLEIFVEEQSRVPGSFRVLVDDLDNLQMRVVKEPEEGKEIIDFIEAPTEEE